MLGSVRIPAGAEPRATRSSEWVQLCDPPEGQLRNRRDPGPPGWLFGWWGRGQRAPPRGAAVLDPGRKLDF